ncbi:35d531db-59df-4230-8978-674e19884d66 [Thermothielavioides terrestris]|uniref:35d531db-59df-4230-8978-674e19884d66 n=1 Tax=Thermothielavioides terrestris TaxID=2587410 RepID=A0A446BLB7_9PEZI|nr:35d531db-59df-4230-8978-674e19884d66 [Thermothielavioides terrestris]
MADSSKPSADEKPPTYKPQQLYDKPRRVNAEDLELYTRGGYAPIDLGLTFEARGHKYTVLHKLGFGPSATVWLVRRSNGPSGACSFHALKVLRADLSTPERNLEFKTMQRLEQVGWNCRAHPNLVQIQEVINMMTPNGLHRCYLQPLLGPSLFHPSIAEPTRRQRHFSRQLVYAVNYLHAFEVCHSNLSPEHVLVKFPQPYSGSEENALLNCLGPVVSEEIVSRGILPAAHHPRAVVEPASFSGFDYSSVTDVALVGFGNAFAAIFPPPVLRCPVRIFPVEVLFGHEPSPKSDIWELACLLMMLHAEPDHLLHQSCYVRLVYDWVTYLGPMPSHWRGRYRWDRYNTLTPPGQMQHQDLLGWFDVGGASRPLSRVIAASASHLTPIEREALAALLREMFAWEPEKRPTSGMVLSRLLQLKW